MDVSKITKRVAVDLFGSQAQLAKALGLTRGAVWHWAWDEPIPEQYAYRIVYVIKPGAFAASVA